MDCHQAQEAILEMLDGGPAIEIREHLATCPGCSAFAARQSALDRELGELIQAPALSREFRAGLRKRIQQEPSRLWTDALPDLLHFGTCAAATLLCAAVLPVAAGPVLGVGALVTGSSYVLILATRSWIEE